MSVPTVKEWRGESRRKGEEKEKASDTANSEVQFSIKYSAHPPTEPGVKFSSPERCLLTTTTFKHDSNFSLRLGKNKKTSETN